jgi:hypothetical protein
MNIWNRWHRWITGLSATFAVASIVLGFFHFTEKFDTKSKLKIFQAGVLLFWIAAPPVWFWFEYYFLYKKLGPPSGGPLKQSLEEYKHGVDVSSKIWLALITVLLGMYFGKDLSRDSSPSPCTQQSSEVRQSFQGGDSNPSGGVPVSNSSDTTPH